MRKSELDSDTPLILWSLFESSKWQVGTGLLAAKLHKAV